ncbi:MAG TPA: Mur ligase family protein [Candidatus Dormibacteraeota bacterium]|nr:Mur ligase family protein [Candidatus Dormibacteraeota bacterium]
MPLTYRQALDALVASGREVAGMRLGLARIDALMSELDAPHAGLRGVLVAGTNGKGSVAAMVESACRAAGLTTVMLAKPHLRSYRERFLVDGRQIADEEFAERVEELMPAAERVASGAGRPTQFELLTALGILVARARRPDVVVCEVGIGGRLDSTNVLDLGVAAITTVAFDHREVLGDTIAAIASEKAGILKAGDHVVCGAGDEALDVVRGRAAEVGAGPVLAIGDGIERRGGSLGLEGVEVEVSCRGWEVAARVPLPGAFQVDNAAVAVGVCRSLAERGHALEAGDVARGLARVSWLGRLQWIAGSPPILVDGAHNGAAIAAIVPAVREIAGDRDVIALVGVMADKDVDDIFTALRPLDATMVFTQAGNPRAARSTELARGWGAGARAIASLPDALAAARMLARDTGIVLVAGSIYLAGDVLALLDAGVPD